MKKRQEHGLESYGAYADLAKASGTVNRGALWEVLSQELPPKYIEQDAKQGPSSRSTGCAGSWLQACSSSKELRGLGVRAQVHV